MRLFIFFILSVFLSNAIFAQKKQEKVISDFIRNASEFELVTKSTDLLYDNDFADADYSKDLKANQYLEYIYVSSLRVQRLCNVTYSEIESEYTLGIPKEKLVFPVTHQDVQDQPIEFINYFGYNKNVVQEVISFNDFMSKVELKIKNTDKIVTIKIFSSASKVPTAKFKNNKNLAVLRSINALKEVTEYLNFNKIDLAKVNVEVVEASVDGPAYNQDPANVDKYAPYQFVKITVK